MKAPGFTPGPWVASAVARTHIVAPNSDQTIAHVQTWGGDGAMEWEGNVALIAATPDMLHWLAVAADAIDDLDKKGVYAEEHEAIVALIKKASRT